MKKEYVCEWSFETVYTRLIKDIYQKGKKEGSLYFPLLQFSKGYIQVQQLLIAQLST